MLRGTLLDRYGFHGREHDSLTGLRHHRAREFNGQFWMSEDPIGFAAGDANLYRFVGNGPGNATDPSGMQNGKQIKLEITKLPDGSFLVKMPDLSIRRVPNQKALDDLKRAYERNGEEEEPGPWEGGTGNNAPKSKVNPVEIPHETVHSEDKLKKSLPPVLQDHFGRTRNEIEAEKNACREPNTGGLSITWGDIGNFLYGAIYLPYEALTMAGDLLRAAQFGIESSLGLEPKEPQWRSRFARLMPHWNDRPAVAAHARTSFIGMAIEAATWWGANRIAGMFRRGLPALRQAYIREVEALKDVVDNMRAAGKSAEEIARTVSQMRRDIGIKYKDLTPPEKREEIYKRNQRLYGDKLGPTVDLLRERLQLGRNH